MSRSKEQNRFLLNKGCHVSFAFMTDQELLYQLSTQPIRKNAFSFPWHPLQLLTLFHLISSFLVNVWYYHPIHISCYLLGWLGTVYTGYQVCIREPTRPQTTEPSCIICGPIDTESMHCKYCNKCYHHLDHHCFYTNCCIASHNYKWYVASLVCVLVTSLSSLIGLSLRLLHSKELEYLILYGIETSKNGFVFGFCGYLLILHIYLIRTNQTTLEYSKRKRVHVEA
jgi:hypothetical protein